MPTAKFRKFGLSSPLEGLNVDKVFELETFALVSRMTTQPTTQRKRQIDTLVRKAKAAGIWQKLDALYVLAAADAQAALLNWIGVQHGPLVPVGTLNFTADRGYKGDGVSGYLDNAFTALTAVKYQQDSASAAVWVYEGAITDAVIAYAAAGGNLRITPPAVAAGTIAARINSGTTRGISGVLPRTGLFSVIRDSSTHIAAYRNGVFAGENLADPSTAKVATMSVLLRRDTVYVDDRVGVAAFGALDATQQLDFYNLLLEYMTAVGAA